MSLRKLLIGIIASNLINAPITNIHSYNIIAPQVKIAQIKEKNHIIPSSFDSLEEMREEIDTWREFDSIKNKEYTYISDISNYECIDYIASPNITFKKKSGDCDDFMLIAYYCLEDNYGENLKLFYMSRKIHEGTLDMTISGINIGIPMNYETGSGHVGCILNTEEGYRFIDGVERNTYETIESLVKGFEYNRFGIGTMDDFPDDWVKTTMPLKIDWNLIFIEGYEQPENVLSGELSHENVHALKIGNKKDIIKEKIKIKKNLEGDINLIPQRTYLN